MRNTWKRMQKNEERIKCSGVLLIIHQIDSENFLRNIVNGYIKQIFIVRRRVVFSTLNGSLGVMLKRCILDIVRFSRFNVRVLQWWAHWTALILYEFRILEKFAVSISVLHGPEESLSNFPIKPFTTQIHVLSDSQT